MATILVIEDSDGQRAEIRAALEEAQVFDQVIEANDGIQGLKLLLSSSPDVVLCDLEMPGLDGEKLLRMSRSAAGADGEIPFLVLTAVTDPERRARLLEKGAADAITKPFHTADLIARIGLHLKLVMARRELLEKNEELRLLSRTDDLTGLPNRRAIDERLWTEFRRAKRYGTPFAVVIADIDKFKSVNDDYGHDVGDQVLVRVAQNVRDVVRETDFGGRFGGEEFLAILGNNDTKGGAVFAERCRALVESIPIELPTGEKIQTTMSFGVAEWYPSSESPDSIVKRADSALYEAKEKGRNRVCTFRGDALEEGEE